MPRASQAAPIPVAPPRLQRRVCRLVRALERIALTLAQRQPSEEELLGQGAELAFAEVAWALEAGGKPMVRPRPLEAPPRSRERASGCPQGPSRLSPQNNREAGETSRPPKGPLPSPPRGQGPVRKLHLTRAHQGHAKAGGGDEYLLGHRIMAPWKEP